MVQQGDSAPYGFQPLRLVGKALDGELLLLRTRPGPVTSSNRRRHPCRARTFLWLAVLLKSDLRGIAPLPDNQPFRHFVSIQWGGGADGRFAQVVDYQLEMKKTLGKNAQGP